MDLPALRATGIRKQFGDLVANDRVDFELREGEIHALVGENGAGKTTLMKMLFGMLRPDAGKIEVAGDPVEFRSVADAIRAGVGMVHQHFMLVPEFSVLRNVTLGAEPRRLGLLDTRASEKALAAPMKLVGLDIDIERKASDLSIAEQQRVEIAKVLYRGARVMILDEPTAVLTPQESSQLFATLRDLAREGVSVVLITHKLREVMAVADRVTVLRRGRTRGSFPVAEVDIPRLVALMTGRSDVQMGRVARAPRTDKVRLVVDGVTGKRHPDCAVRDLSFVVHEGEIVGIAGVDGNGQNSLVALLTGTEPTGAGTVTLDGENVAGLSIAEYRQRGLGFVPEDRHADGLPLHAPVVEALAAARLASRKGLGAWGPAITGSTRQWARQLVERFDIAVASISVESAGLSGGNQQKIVLARELDTDPRLLVMAQPTRGVDLGAAEGIHNAISGLAASGAAVVVVSADLDELLRLTDRILVLYRGEVVADIDASTASRNDLGLAMSGHRSEAA